jgi:hypothetical protein
MHDTSGPVGYQEPTPEEDKVRYALFRFPFLLTAEWFIVEG